MNSSMSGWSTARMPMLAPRRVPPCLIASVAASNTLRNETGPDATPIVERTRSPRGRRREKAKPVPPPDWWMTAVSLIASKMPSMLSGTGSTKQAESCWSSRPAFISVGEFGRKSRRLHQCQEALLPGARRGYQHFRPGCTEAPPARYCERPAGIAASGVSTGAPSRLWRGSAARGRCARCRTAEGGRRGLVLWSSWPINYTIGVCRKPRPDWHCWRLDVLTKDLIAMTI